MPRVKNERSYVEEFAAVFEEAVRSPPIESLANQRMAAALKAKGCAYRYVFADAAGHTDGRVTRRTLPGAVEWLWQGYPRK